MSPGDLGEDELIRRGRAALARIERLPPGSAMRSLQRALYETYAAEPGRRVLRAVARLRAVRGRHPRDFTPP